MADAVFSITELVGTSSQGVEAAIQNAIDRASKTLRNVDWFQVEEIRGYISEGRPQQYQVRLKIGFKLDN
jgi:flavin-binding protein dodecin